MLPTVGKLAKHPGPSREIPVTLPEAVIQRLEMFAGATGRSRSGAIRYACMRLLTEYERDMRDGRV